MPGIFNLRNNAERELDEKYSYTDQVGNFVFLIFKVGFLFLMISINFVALSVALNCNKDSTQIVKFSAAVFAFFFGFVYLIVNYYTYRVLSQKKICDFDKERLFPF